MMATKSAKIKKPRTKKARLKGELTSPRHHASHSSHAPRKKHAKAQRRQPTQSQNALLKGLSPLLKSARHRKHHSFNETLTRTHTSRHHITHVFAHHPHYKNHGSEGNRHGSGHTGSSKTKCLKTNQQAVTSILPPSFYGDGPISLYSLYYGRYHGGGRLKG